MRLWRIGLLCAVGMTCVVLTAARIHTWGDERLVWWNAVQVSPDKPRPWVNLGREYHLQGSSALAAYAYGEARRAAEAPGRSKDEQLATEAVARINLGLLELAAGTGRAQVVALPATQLLGRDPAIDAGYAWIQRTVAR